jgi:SAM-dependent methyltransferase
MNQYKNLAKFYDSLNSNAEYEKFIIYYNKIFKKFKISPKIIADLGCGSGTLTELLAKQGYDMIGIDMSTDMLNISMKKKIKSNLDILYINQDICSFELYGTTDAIVCALDTINHITNKKDVLSCFKTCNLYLDPFGIFIFDINTRYKFEQLLHGNSSVYESQDAFCVSEHTYDKKDKLFYYDITIFYKEQNDIYSRLTDCVIERAYTIEEITDLLNRAGFKNINIYDKFTFKKPHDKSERVFFVVRK